MIKRNDLIEKIKEELEKNDIKTLGFIYEYAKYQNMTETEKEEYKYYKFNIISRIVNKLSNKNSICYDCLVTEKVAEKLVEKENKNG